MSNPPGAEHAAEHRRQCTAEDPVRLQPARRLLGGGPAAAQLPRGAEGRVNPVSLTVRWSPLTRTACSVSVRPLLYRLTIQKLMRPVLLRTGKRTFIVRAGDEGKSATLEVWGGGRLLKELQVQF